MASLRDFLNQLFKKNQEGYQVPFLHESYQFDATSESYVLWKGQYAHSALSQKILEVERAYKSESDLPKGTDILNSPKMAGISLQCDLHRFQKTDYINLSSFVIEKLKRAGYILSLSEIKSRKHKGNIEQSIKGYLKPSRKMVKNKKALQLYGNVNIELISINHALSRYNISCSYYQDQHFHPPLDFSEFIISNFSNE